MHMYKISFLIISCILVFFLAGCSEVKNDVTSPQSVAIHPAGYNNFASPDFHGKQFSKNYNWSMTECQKCHAANYSGGTAGQSCLGAGCHNTVMGPEACNTCHGVFADTNKIAPPRDLSGGISYTSAGVGAHQIHLNGGSIGAAVKCVWCHTVPATVNATGHLDAVQGAEIMFDSLAKFKTDTLNPNPSYSRTTQTCANTYCHGYFKGGNKTNAPKWTAGPSGAACGSCHGSGTNPLPPSPHPQIKNCQMCHSSAIIVTATATDTTYTFKDITKHVNGIINY